MLSTIFPMLFLPSNQIPQTVRVGAIIVFIIIGVTLSQYRKHRLAEGAWGFSDLIVYFLVPSILFFGVGSLFLFASE